MLFGIICTSLASGGPGKLPSPIFWQIFLSRTLIGVAIGMSCCYISHWSIHGIIMGLLFSLPLSFNSLLAPENPDFTKTEMFVSIIVLGMIYGFLIELITTKFFKAKIQA